MSDDLVKELRFWNGGHKSDEKMKRAANRIEKLEVALQFLFKILDDIDTVDDVAKYDDAFYRNQVRHLHAKRFLIMTTDGYTVSIRDDDIARKALEGKDETIG